MASPLRTIGDEDDVLRAAAQANIIPHLVSMGRIIVEDVGNITMNPYLSDDPDHIEAGSFHARADWSTFWPSGTAMSGTSQ
jgi:hypothetical protein